MLNSALKLHRKTFQELSVTVFMDPCMRGWLIKETENYFSSAKRRFFALRSTSLFYYSSDTDCHSAIGAFALEGARILGMSEEAPCLLQLRLVDGFAVQLIADSPQIALQWYTAIVAVTELLSLLPETVSGTLRNSRKGADDDSQEKRRAIEQGDGEDFPVSSAVAETTTKVKSHVSRKIRTWESLPSTTELLHKKSLQSSGREVNAIEKDSEKNVVELLQSLQNRLVKSNARISALEELVRSKDLEIASLEEVAYGFLPNSDNAFKDEERRQVSFRTKLQNRLFGLNQSSKKGRESEKILANASRQNSASIDTQYGPTEIKDWRNMNEQRDAEEQILHRDTMKDGDRLARRLGSLQSDRFPGGVPDVLETKIWFGSWNMGAASAAKEPSTFVNKTWRSWVTSGKDIYCFGVQECVSDCAFDGLGKYLSAISIKDPIIRVPLKVGTDRICGRGDGSLLATKYTGVAVYCRKSLIESGAVCVLSSSTRGYGALGSKGGVGVVLSVFGSTLCLVNCHLLANNREGRSEQVSDIIEELGNELGCKNFDLTSQFHNIVWMGDLNYRLEGVSCSDVLKGIGGKEEDLRNLRERYDSLLDDIKIGKAFVKFIEPKMSEGFFPTYKMFEGRFNFDSSNGGDWKKILSDSSWPSKLYRTKYKEPIYKGGLVKERCPSWCDRILTSALTQQKPSSNFFVAKLTPEKMPGHNTDFYKAMHVKENLDISDHAPVFACFSLKSRPFVPVAVQEEGKSVPSTVEKGFSPKCIPYGRHGYVTRIYLEEVRVRIENVNTSSGSAFPNRTAEYAVFQPDRVQVLFPAPFEDGQISVPRNFISLDGDLRPAAFTWTGVKHPLLLHVVLKVNFEKHSVAQSFLGIGDKAETGQCVIALHKLRDTRNPTGSKQKVCQRLWKNGLPLSDPKGRPIMVSFTIGIISALLVMTNGGKNSVPEMVRAPWRSLLKEIESCGEEEEDSFLLQGEDKEVSLLAMEQFQMADKNQDGSISKNELVDQIKLQFDLADKNHDGKVQIKELESLFEKEVELQKKSIQNDKKLMESKDTMIL
eukprot:g3386.t1